ncbi:MAG: gamma-glutamyltransferase [Rhodospirillaceae bacterium]|nr:gamma-glutamyltransferase [Rhodospirillaceae bacterium]
MSSSDLLARVENAPYDTRTLTKPKIVSDKGVVVSQNVEAATVGADILRSGGNAIDAAVGTALALTVAEPWMSGLGGGGFMVIHSARDKTTKVIDFGMVAPKGLKVSDYKLAGGQGGDLFGWPSVEGDINIHGPKAIAVPGSPAGYALALETYGTKSWAEVSQPAIAMADRGHRITWWSTLQVASDAPILARYPDSAKVYLANGYPPVMSPDPTPAYMDMGNLATTLRTLADKGPREFYEGEIARSLASSVQALGGTLSTDDLVAYQARLLDPLTVKRGGVDLHVPQGLSAGPTFADAMSRLPDTFSGKPDAETYGAYAAALIAAYEKRLETMGHAGDIGDRSCTTHLSAVDAEGNMVAITTTLLSRFGSRVVLGDTGVLMNNGINWFDPRPGLPNSLTPGERPLSNMCPLIATRDGEAWFAFGASGGRKIMPAVLQLANFVTDFGMDIEQAFAQPRIDVSPISRVIADARLDDAAIAAIERTAPAQRWAEMESPATYATPVAVAREAGQCQGAAHIYSPLVGAAGA